MANKRQPTPEELQKKLREDFFHAVERGMAAQVQKYINAGVNVDALSGTGRTALLYAVEKGQLEVVRVLLANRARVNATIDPALASFNDSAGATPLTLAAQYNYTAIAETLLAHGASLSAADKYGLTALHYAAKRGNAGLAELLLDLGADPLATDQWKHAPAYYAQANGYKDLAALIEKRATPPRRPPPPSP